MTTKFRTGFSAAAGSGNAGKTYAELDLLTRGGSHRILQNYLKEGSTIVRIIPSITDGEEDIHLNPDATEKTPMEELFSPTCTVVEMFQELGNNRATFMSSWTTRDGTRVGDNWSVGRVWAYHFRRKVAQYKIDADAGLRPNIPQEWSRLIQYAQYRIKDPSNQLLVQCMASTIDDVVCVDARGSKILDGPFVLAIPKSAVPQFLADVRERHDPDSPLTLANSTFGDFCSCASGRMLKIRKLKSTPEHQSDNKEHTGKTVYNLQLTNKAYPLTVEFAEEMYRPWEKLLNIPCVEDVIQYLADSVGWLSVDFGLRGTEYHKYIPEQHQGISDHIESAPENLKEYAKEVRERPREPEGGDVDLDDVPALPALPTRSAPRQEPALLPAAPPTPPARAFAPSPVTAHAYTEDDDDADFPEDPDDSGIDEIPPPPPRAPAAKAPAPPAAKAPAPPAAPPPAKTQTPAAVPMGSDPDMKAAMERARERRAAQAAAAGGTK